MVGRFQFRDDQQQCIQIHNVASNLDLVPEYRYEQSIDHIFVANNPTVGSYAVKDFTVDMYVYGDKQQYASDHWAIISTVNIKQIENFV